MFSEPVLAAMLLFALLALAEFLSVISRARIPMLLVIIFGYFILLWTGIFPKDLASKAGLSAFAMLIPAPLIVHLGTLIPFKLIKEQYKAVLIALFGVIIAAALVLGIGTPIIGYKAAAAGTGPLTGGIIAFLITSGKLQELGLVSLVTIPVLVLGLQSIVGMPLAANLLRKHALKFKKTLDPSNMAAAANENAATNEEQDEGRSWIPKKYQTQIILLFQIFLGGAIAVLLGKLTGISYSLWALFIGIVGTYFGFYQSKMLERANSLGITMAAVVVTVLISLGGITPAMFADHLPEVIFIIIVGTIGILMGGFIGSKLFKWDLYKGMPVALTALFGFPADYIICQEVSRSVAENEQEQKVVFNEILTPMLVGGFTTVSAASIVISAILVSTL